MPKIKLALYDHPVRAGLDSIRSSKIDVKTGWVASQELCVELLNLTAEPLTETETRLVFRVLRTVIANHAAFPITISEVPGLAKGDPTGTGDDALSETRLFVKSNGAIQALRLDLKKSLRNAGFTRILDSDEAEQAFTETGEKQQAGPFMTVSKLPIDKMSEAHIAATQNLAFYLSKFVIKTPVTNIVLDPEFDGPKYLLTLPKRPEHHLTFSGAAAASPAISFADDICLERKETAEAKARREAARIAAQSDTLHLTDDISVDLGFAGKHASQLASGLRSLAQDVDPLHVDTRQQLSHAKSIEITNQLVNAIIEINEENDEEFDKRMFEIISLTSRPEYNPDMQFAPEKLTPLQIAQRLAKGKTYLQLMKINTDKKRPAGLLSQPSFVSGLGAAGLGDVPIQCSGKPKASAASAAGALESLPIVDCVASRGLVVPCAATASATPLFFQGPGNAGATDNLESPRLKLATAKPAVQQVAKTPEQEALERAMSNPAEADKLITAGMAVVQAEIDELRKKSLSAATGKP